MIFRWLSSLSIACLAQRAAALASAHSKDHLVIHEAGDRTALLSGFSVAANGELDDFEEVSDEVGRRLGQSPSPDDVITEVTEDTVFGNLMLLTVRPTVFANSARREVQGAIKGLLQEWSLAARDVGVKLTVSPESPYAVRVDFTAIFEKTQPRQTFIWNVLKDSGEVLSDRICAQVPKTYKEKVCRLTSGRQSSCDRILLQTSSASLHSDRAEAALDVHQSQSCSGTVLLRTFTDTSPLDMVINERRQEAFALAISQVSWVSRLQVGTLMSVEGSLVRVDFWFTGLRSGLCKAATKRVADAGNFTTCLASRQSQNLKFAATKANEFSAHGRFMLQVADPQSYVAKDRAPLEAVQKAIAQLASTQDTQFPVENVTVSFDRVKDVSKAVWASFKVTFGVLRERQVFIWDFARDKREKLANCAVRSNCQLQDTTSPQTADLGQRFDSFRVFVSWPQLLSKDPVVQEAASMAISEIAAVFPQQVGLFLSDDSNSSVTVDYWVALTNATARQAALDKVDLAGYTTFERCTLAKLDSALGRDTWIHADSMNVSVPLVMPGFTNSWTVREAVGSAIAQVVGLDKVFDLDFKEEPLQVVRINFRIRLGTLQLRQAFTRDFARDGAERLAVNISQRLPGMCKGKCGVPKQALSANLDQPSGTPAQNYGTMVFFVFFAQEFVRSEVAQEAVVTTIAKVASVPHSQVVVTLSARSAVLVSIDFWVLSTDAKLRQAAVQRVNKKWNRLSLDDVRDKMDDSFLTRTYMIRDGTVESGTLLNETCS